ncbi:MAG: FAD synthase [Methanomethylovorans sp.]|nr:FAD synthase [Methanomethylovorans sp.]
MIRVLATGTFDLLHPGHLTYLKECKSLGDELYVIVARDSMIRHKPRPVIPEKQRVEMIGALKMVDRAILGNEGDIFEPIMEIKPDIIALGYNQHFSEKELEKELEKRGLHIRVVRIKKSDKCALCSSAKIVKRIIERYG